MPDSGYYRKQALLCAHLAATSSDRQNASRYNEMAREYLGKARKLEEVEASPPLQPFQLRKTGGGDTGGA
jgi:hypothetical protein